MTTVGVAGASGSLGKEILAVLDKSPWRPAKVVALASNRTTVSTVDFGEDSLPVDDLSQQAMGDLDAILLAVPASVAREVGESAVSEGVFVVDASGAFADDDDVPTVIPWVNPEALREPPLRGLIAVPGAAATLVASVLGPLRRAGLTGRVHATVLVPASLWGREGVEELSRQVVALFNSAPPPRKVFDQGLAFDLIPSVGSLGGSGWTDSEGAALVELRRVLGEGVDGSVTMIGVPVFSGISAEIVVETETSVDVEKVALILSKGGCQLVAAGARALPRPRKVEGQPLIHVGRLRNAPNGRGIHVWASADNLHGVATVMVSGCRALLKSVGKT